MTFGSVKIPAFHEHSKWVLRGFSPEVFSGVYPEVISEVPSEVPSEVSSEASLRFSLRFRPNLLMLFIVQMTCAFGWVNTNISGYLFCHRQLNPAPCGWPLLKVYRTKKQNLGFSVFCIFIKAKQTKWPVSRTSTSGRYMNQKNRMKRP
jgi:hypothetical protein